MMPFDKNTIISSSILCFDRVGIMRLKKIKEVKICFTRMLYTYNNEVKIILRPYIFRIMCLRPLCIRDDKRLILSLPYQKKNFFGLNKVIINVDFQKLFIVAFPFVPCMREKESQG